MSASYWNLFDSADTEIFRGCGLLSRLVTYYPQYLIATVFISVGYIEPGSGHDISTYTCYPGARIKFTHVF